MREKAAAAKAESQELSTELDKAEVRRNALVRDQQVSAASVFPIFLFHCNCSRRARLQICRNQAHSLCIS